MIKVELQTRVTKRPRCHHGKKIPSMTEGRRTRGQVCGDGKGQVFKMVAGEERERRNGCQLKGGGEMLL
jgi:hypothetical protein